MSTFDLIDDAELMVACDMNNQYGSYVAVWTAEITAWKVMYMKRYYPDEFKQRVEAKLTELQEPDGPRGKEAE